MLQNATSNCLVAELGLEQALKWAKEVETLGLGNSPEDTADVGVEPRDVALGEYGPLYDELVNVNALYVQALKNCDKEVYQQCVLDDTDPNVPFLGIVQAQLQYLDDDPVYYERYINCSIGWHGTFTAHEEISGSSRGRRDYPNGSSSTLTWDASGTRDLKIERANHAQGATGSAQGHSTTTQKIVTADKQCTSTTTSMVEQTATGSGDAVLRKIGTATNGDFVLSFIGPNEPDSNQHSTTTSQSSCARGASNPQKSDAIGRTAPFSGSIGDKLSDPYVERTSGRKIMRFQMGNLIQQTTGGTLVRDTGSGGSDYNPWLTAFFSDTEPNNQPVVNVTITWNLAFGQQ
jgi:hypothetical protein